MVNYFNSLNLNSLIGMDIPFWALIAAPVAIILLVLFLIWFIPTRIFKSRLRKIINAQDATQSAQAISKFEKHYPAEKLVRYSSRMERYSRQMGSKVVRETGLADKWVQKLSHSPSPAEKDLRRVLLYCPESSYFKAFLAAEQHPRLRKVFSDWMQGEGEEKVIRLLAESCRGESFVPDLSKGFLENNRTLLYELTGEPEWYARFFVYRILLLDNDTLTERTIDDGLLDTNPLIRKTLIENISFDHDKIWNVLWDKLIHDPVYEVREAARIRIGKEYMDRYNPKDVIMSDEETARVLELLNLDCQEDKIFAMASLESTNTELRYHAAVFLEKCGALLSLLTKNTLDDPTTLEQSVSLLQKALEVNVSGFLADYSSGDGGSLLAAARLLSGPAESAGGTAEHICVLEKKVFEFFHNKEPSPYTKEIYTKTLEAVINNGNVKSFELVAEELSRRESDKVFLEMLLPRLPKKAEAVFAPILFRFLENPVFPLRDELVQVLGTFNPDIILPKMFQILDNGQPEQNYIVYTSALKILGSIKLPFCLQNVLERLPAIKPEDAEEFGRLIAGYPQDMFESKARTLLASPDAGIRASLIAILPITKNDSFMKDVRSSLKDVDPDVRVAAIKALLGFGELKFLNQETSMLRDPVERVRLATAEVIAKHGNAAAMEILDNVTKDPNETDVVQIGVIMGLGQGSNAEGITILVNILDSNDELRGHAEQALSMRTAKRDITQLIEIFKDAEPQLREKLIPVFKTQGSKAEPQIVEILKDEVASLKPYFVSILEETGYIGMIIRRLSNKKAEIRREAALQLSLMETISAYRGLVLAAKDPDQEVRVCVVKALDKLKNSQSYEILENLKKDPDNRIRKYTHWALERLDSLGME
ncbi:MAG: HEAT repeat domain-containing protein [Treponema sp.]|nr:HEAT repeat domain-containing protein [Treponema sp.]